MSKATGPQCAAILGGGSIGASWAALFVQHGFDTRIWDPKLEAAHLAKRVSTYLEEMPTPACNRGTLTVAPTSVAAVGAARFVQECGPEDLALKEALFTEISPALQSGSVVASSTSTFMPTQIQTRCTFAERLLVGHPFNPPHVVPLVEVVCGLRTSPETLASALEVYETLQRRVIVLKSERPGHLANRLQAALWREAIDAVASGLATVEDVDAALTFALGARWALMGPFLTFHLAGGEGGLDHFLDHLGGAFEALWDDLQQPDLDAGLRKELTRQMARRAAGVTAAEWSRWRDARLPGIFDLAATSPALPPGG